MGPASPVPPPLSSRSPSSSASASSSCQQTVGQSALQLHHKSFSSSLQVASRCTCHMLPNVGNFPLFLSFQIKTQIPNRATRSEVQRLRCASPSHTLFLSLACSQFLDLWLRFEYNYVVSKIFESSGKLRPCIFETSNRFEHI